LRFQGFRVQGLGLRAEGLGVRVEGYGFRSWPCLKVDLCQGVVLHTNRPLENASRWTVGRADGPAKRACTIRSAMHIFCFLPLILWPTRRESVKDARFPGPPCVVFARSDALSPCPCTRIDSEQSVLAPAPLAPTRTLRQPLGRPMDTPFSAREPSGQLNLPASSLCKSPAETDERTPRQRCTGSGMVDSSSNPGFPPLRRTPLRHTDGNSTTSSRISRVVRYSEAESELDTQSWRIHRQGLTGVSCGTHHRAGVRAEFLTRCLAERPHPPSFLRCKRVPSFVCLGVTGAQISRICEFAPGDYTNAKTL